jgi:hypothetical protein
MKTHLPRSYKKPRIFLRILKLQLKVNKLFQKHCLTNNACVCATSLTYMLYSTGEITRLETMKRQKTDERLAKLDTRRSELASLEDVRRDEIYHLNEALSFLEKMRDVENAIRDAEVELTEDGQELNLMSEEHENIIADLKARIAESEESNVCDGNDREDMQTCASPTMKRRLSQ